jgi:hypothetical protein
VVEAPDENVYIVVWKVVDLQWDDEVPNCRLKLLRHSLRTVEFLQRTVLRIGRPRQNKEKFDSAFFDCLLDVVPKRFSAQELRQIAPHGVANVGELE